MPTSRSGGCTLTGALSVTTQVRDAATIVHGPRGCAHHNFSLLHATLLDNGDAALPELVSTGLSEQDIVFGGSDALARSIESACAGDVSAIFVLSACVVATIGDDVEEVCGRDWPVPVLPVPTAGFLGGSFQEGVCNALTALSDLAEPAPAGSHVAIIGEKNLEYEVEENHAEIVRLLSLLGLGSGLRFVRSLRLDDIGRLGSARLNILRDPSLLPVGMHLKDRFGTPFVPSFPAGLSDTLAFLEEVARACGISPDRALRAEREFQERVLDAFSDIGGAEGILNTVVADQDSIRAAQEAARALCIGTGRTGALPSLPVHPVVGTSGVKRMLHRWRRSIHA